MKSDITVCDPATVPPLRRGNTPGGYTSLFRAGAEPAPGTRVITFKRREGIMAPTATETKMVEKTKFYTVEEVADIVGLDETTIRMFLRHGDKSGLRGRRIGKRWYITEPDLQAFIDGEAAAEVEAAEVEAFRAWQVEQVMKQDREAVERQRAFEAARKADKPAADPS